jgi:hypothetical protein
MVPWKFIFKQAAINANATLIHLFKQESDQMAIDHKMMEIEVDVLYLAALFISSISVKQTSHKAWPKSISNALAAAFSGPSGYWRALKCSHNIDPSQLNLGSPGSASFWLVGFADLSKENEPEIIGLGAPPGNPAIVQFVRLWSIWDLIGILLTDTLSDLCQLNHLFIQGLHPPSADPENN